MVTPTFTDFYFEPAARTYYNITSNQTNNDFAAVANPIPTPVISGNVGVAGATLSYWDGSVKTVVSDGSGDYSISIPSRWSGTITPSLDGYRFIPSSKTYSIVVADDTGEDYVADQTKYWVSAAGNDANAGTQAAPWLHCPWSAAATGVSAATVLQGGDTIYCNGGDSDAHTWTPPNGGSAGSPILFTNYGTGRYIIDGSAQAHGCFYNWVTDPKHYIWLDQIEFNGSAAGSGKAAVSAMGHDFCMSNCYVHDADFFGVSCSGIPSDGANNYNLTFDHDLFDHNQDCGLYIGSDTGEYGPHDCLVVDSIASNNGFNSPIIYPHQPHGFYSRHGVHYLRVKAFGNYDAGLKVNCQQVISAYTPLVEDSEFYDNKVGIEVDNYYAIIRNNYIHHNHDANINCDGPINNIQIYGNTLVNMYAGSGALTFINTYNAGVHFANNIIKNNVIIQDRSLVLYHKFIRVEGYETIDMLQSLNTFDYNVYYYDGNLISTLPFIDTVDTTAYSITQWKAMSGAPDAHSTFLAVPPQFESTDYTDCRPVDGNVKGVGVALAAGLDDYDLNGVLRTDLTPGAYVATATPPPTPPHTYIDLNQETDDLTQWTTDSSGGKITVTAAAALAGSNSGLSVLCDSVTDKWLVLSGLPSTYGRAKVRIYIDPNTLTMGASEATDFLRLYNIGGNLLATVALKYSSGYQIYAGLYTDASTWVYTAGYSISDSSHYVDIDLTRATTNVAGDGSLKLTIDLVDKATVTGDNYDNFSTWASMRVGKINADAGTSGTFFLDEILGNDTGEDFPTPPPLSLNVVINHEAGTLAEWTTDSSGGKILVDAAAALNSTNYGLSVLVDTTLDKWLTKSGLASTTGKARLRIYIDSNTLTMARYDTIDYCRLYNNGGTLLATIKLKYDGGYQVVAGLYNDTPAWVYTAAYTITDAPHYVEIYLQRSSGAGVSDGSLLLTVDGTDKETITGVNYTDFASWASIRAGKINSMAGTSGTFFLDELEYNDDGTLIGA